MAAVSMVRVTSEREMEMAISAYIAQGFVLANRSSEGATMFKKKEFSVLWAVVGFVICLLPLLIYLIVYASQKDQMVQIQIAPAGQLELPAATSQVGQRSPDGNWWWDGAAWQPVAQPTPTTQPAIQQAAASADWLPAPDPTAEQTPESGDVTPPGEAKPTQQ